MFEAEIFTLSTKVRTGGGQWLGEAVATFGLVATILGCLRARPDAVPYAVGLFITAGYWFTSSTSFANPAVTIARALTDTFSGIRPDHAPGFILAQLVGAVLAVLLFRWLLQERMRAEPAGATGTSGPIGPTQGSRSSAQASPVGASSVGSSRVPRWMWVSSAQRSPS